MNDGGTRPASSLGAGGGASSAGCAVVVVGDQPSRPPDSAR